MKRMHAVKTIVTPIDFSENASVVIDSAAYMAGVFGAELHILFVVQNFEDYSGFFVPQMNVPNIEHELFVGAEEQMAKFCKQHEAILKDAGVGYQTKVLVGDVAEKIVEYADEMHADMILMGTHGYKGLERIMFGSVADKVVKSSDCPVTTINPYTCTDEDDG